MFLQHLHADYVSDSLQHEVELVNCDPTGDEVVDQGFRGTRVPLVGYILQHPYFHRRVVRSCSGRSQVPLNNLEHHK